MAREGRGGPWGEVDAKLIKDSPNKWLATDRASPPSLLLLIDLRDSAPNEIRVRGKVWGVDFCAEYRDGT